MMRLSPLEAFALAAADISSALEREPTNRWPAYESAKADLELVALDYRDYEKLIAAIEVVIDCELRYRHEQQPRSTP